MSEKDLCWKCREWLEWATHHGVLHSAVKEAPFLACSHEPKEKEKCWCETHNHHQFLNIDELGYQQADFCPKCGRPLK